MKPIIALCDANSFYCSCEQVFDPSLGGKALGVLSNNDGCIVARTRELKAMGVAMGTPAFKVRGAVERGEIILKSSNYALYGDMSSRFMTVLEQFSPRLEIYSIDEAFVDLTGFATTQAQVIGQEMKQRVQRWTGLPIGVGISTTKTLAKLANYAAKRYPATKGVVDLTNPVRQRRLMEITPVGEVWGVGRRIEERLAAAGIHSAAQLADASRAWVKKNFSIVLERTACELQGESCLPWEEESPGNKHQVMCSRSFGNRVTTADQLHSALVTFISRGCEKLREQQQFAKEAIIFIRTDPFKKHQCRSSHRHSANKSIRIAAPAPTNDCRLWLQQLPLMVEALFQEGCEYKKAGVMFMELCSTNNFQISLLEPRGVPEISPIMSVMDHINRKFGRNSLKIGSMGIKVQSWHMKQQFLSQRYTTCWSDILQVKA